MAQDSAPLPPLTVPAQTVQYTVQNAPNTVVNVQTVPQMTTQNPIVVYTQTRNAQVPRIKRVYVDFDVKKTKALGIIQIVTGILSVIFVAVGIPVERKLEVCFCDPICVCHGYGTEVFIIGFGYWCPLFFFISGAIAVAAAKQKTSSLIKALLGMSIVSLIFAITLWGSSIGAMAELSTKDKPSRAAMAMGTLLMLCGMVEIATSIWLSKLCGDHICCKGVPNISTTAPVVQYVTTRNADGTFSQTAVQAPRPQVTIPPNVGMTTVIPGHPVEQPVQQLVQQPVQHVLQQPVQPFTGYPQTSAMGQINEGMTSGEFPPPYESSIDQPQKRHVPS